MVKHFVLRNFMGLYDYLLIKHIKLLLFLINVLDFFSKTFLLYKI